MTYHIGYLRRGRTLVIQARRDIDFLDCEIMDYMGERQTTKAQLHRNRRAILHLAQQQRPGVYGALKYAVVD